MNCIIIEDQPPAQRILKKFISDVGSLNLVGVFPDALQAMEFLKQERVDLLFLDVHLPKISGIEFLRTMPNPPNVILTTAFSEYALEGYDLNIVDYLLKPFSFQRFLKAVAKVPIKNIVEEEQTMSATKDYLYIKSGHEHVKIWLNAILHIDSDSDYTEVVTKEKKYLSHESLRYWLENLPGKQFVRVHKSHIVNTTKIEKLVGNQVYLSNDIKIPIGRVFKEHFIKNVLK